MKLVTFTRNYDFVPRDHTQLTYAYYAGDTVEVTDECATRAVALGYADFEPDDDGSDEA